jgi:predicted nuclease of predicted toxin-antitoxin system
MSRTIRFHLDENCGRAIAEGLLRHGIDVTTTPEAGLIGVTDEAQVEYALIKGRVIFTQNGDFLGIHRAGISHNGIAYCPMGSRSTGEIIRSLVDLWEILEPEEMVKWLEFL